jgi:hypothetical protein
MFNCVQYTCPPCSVTWTSWEVCHTSHALTWPTWEARIWIRPNCVHVSSTCCELNLMGGLSHIPRANMTKMRSTYLNTTRLYTCPPRAVSWTSWVMESWWEVSPLHPTRWHDQNLPDLCVGVPLKSILTRRDQWPYLFSSIKTPPSLYLKCHSKYAGPKLTLVESQCFLKPMPESGIGFVCYRFG